MNNNITNNNGWIGSTHIDNIKLTSNILEQHIIIGNINSSNYASNISNVLNINSSNYASNISNILNTNSSNFTNSLRHDVNKWINEEIEHITIPDAYLTHTCIYNSNLLGEIRFITKGMPQYLTNENKNYIIRIKENGAFELFYQYNLQYPSVLGGWYNIMSSIRDAYAYQATNAGIVGEIQIAINGLNSKLIALESGLGALAANVEILNGMTIEQLDTIINDAVSLNLGNIFNNASILGISALGVLGIITSILSNLLYDQYLTAQLKELAKMNNLNITEAEKTAYMEQIKQAAIDNLNEFNIRLRSLNDANGYINSSNQDIQYIPNLSTSNLYINTGNLNKLVSSSSISENGTLLSNKYLTSNHLYNLISSYSSERQYPSKLYTTTQSEDTATLLGKLVYRNLLYLDNSSISYGSGFYEVFSSSTYDAPTTKNKLFNYNTTETNDTPRWGISLYNSATGNYQGDNSIDDNYYGDWVILKMPQPIMLTRFRIYQNSSFPLRSPSEWKVYGSNDGITFTQITEAHQLVRLISTDYTSGYYNKALASTFTTQYQYIGFVFGKLLSTSVETTLNFAELQIFGKEIISNTIDSNIYTTSNAVKGIVEFDMPIVCKHKAFYCQTSTVIYPNLGNTAYYKYDIDMRNYTQTGYIQIGSQSNDPYRIFRIRAFLGSCYFSSLKNGLPDILHYEIYMSYKAQAASGGQGAAGVNIYSIGIPNNPSLNIIPPNNIFILSNPFNDFNYITLVSTSPADIRVIIEDLIS
jgi:hypothetical protein